jgi:hypothetical protein
MSRSSPSLQPTNYWRGPVWVNVNYLTILGLRKYGMIERAAGVCTNSMCMCVQHMQQHWKQVCSIMPCSSAHTHAHSRTHVRTHAYAHTHCTRAHPLPTTKQNLQEWQRHTYELLHTCHTRSRMSPPARQHCVRRRLMWWSETQCPGNTTTRWMGQGINNNACLLPTGCWQRFHIVLQYACVLFCFMSHCVRDRT